MAGKGVGDFVQMQSADLGFSETLRTLAGTVPS